MEQSIKQKNFDYKITTSTLAGLIYDLKEDQKFCFYYNRQTWGGKPHYQFRSSQHSTDFVKWG